MRGKSAQHMSIIGTKNEWGTPQQPFEDALKKHKLKPTLDVCASKKNKMCKKYFGYDHIVLSRRNGLTCAFDEDFYMNPPYDPEYQCNNCGTINSFDWQIYYIKKKREISVFLTDMKSTPKEYADKMLIKGYKPSRKRLACKNCNSGNSHREVLHRGVADWLKKAYSEHLTNNVDGMILTFAKTDTKWWHKYVENKAEVHFIEGRLRFLDDGKVSEYPAPYGSCWIIYRKK